MPDVTGVGIGLRAPHARDIVSTPRVLDFVEIIPENFVGRGGPDARLLDACRERWPILVHGVTASVGGPDPFDDAWLDGLRALLRRLRTPFYTDHLCFTSVGGFQTHELLPLPHSREAVHHAAGRIRTLSARLGLPVAVENVTTYAIMPGSEMSAAEFVAAVCEEADCGLLLDLNNLHVNACNLGGNAHAELDVLPLDRVVQVHVAGHEVRSGRTLDTHAGPVAEPVRALLGDLVRRIGPVPVLLERDQDIPSLDEILDEADGLRRGIA